MSLPHITAPGESGDASEPSRHGGRLNWVSLILATLLLIASVGVGVWLIESAPDGARTAEANQLATHSDLVTYGGDAYTGIQNAAAYTEAAVVDEANTLSALASQLHKEQAAADTERWGHLWDGLAALIILIGAANFILALQRFAAHRRA